eukprot:TRINITY_DN8657_c0_g1_i1.p1 TRINITY_DN8657_c0_g1~~TRINITY_DN8657_c0_g1_i1.p1  ORF type:complete len:320 (+),score=61.83 TRINITY_DN8657_c0_g1_i1:84-1043(+)
MEDFLHGVNNFLYSSFVGGISLNYHLGDIFVRSVIYAAHSLASVLGAIGEAIVILLTDLDHFLIELFEYGKAAQESLSVLGDHLELKYIPFSGLIADQTRVLGWISSLLSDFFYGVGQNLFDSLSLIPQFFQVLFSAFTFLYAHLCHKEVVLGALFCTFLVVYTFKSLINLWERVPPRVLEQFSAFLCLAAYSILLHGGSCTLSLFRVCLRAAALTLNHIHLPSFHHAATGPIESSSSYKRRRLSSSSSSSTTEEEEESHHPRDDGKLCVVCQDEDKCMVIMPCRHLCICQRCKDLLLKGPRSCPICRNRIGHTIKAYL